MLIDNKGDYDVEITREELESEGCPIKEILILRRAKRYKRENDAAFNHACALNEALNRFQRGIILSEISGANPIIIVMDPDFMIVNKQYSRILREKLDSYHLIGTRWTVVKTHKFHNFPSPHFIASNLENLKKIKVIDFKPRPLVRNLTRPLLRNKFSRGLIVYNSFDPGSRMNHGKCKYINISFIEQYYWYKEISDLKKWNSKSVGDIEVDKIRIKDEPKYWINYPLMVIVRLASQLKLFISKRKIINYERLLSKSLIDEAEIKYIDDLSDSQIPRTLSGADIFHYDGETIFAVHGHMNSKSRDKDEFNDYLKNFRDE